MALDIFKLSGTVDVKIGQTEANLKRVDASGKQTAQTLNKTGDAARKAERDFSALSSRLSSLSSVGSKLTLGLSAPLLAFSAAAVKAATDMDSLKRGLTAVSGSSAEAEKQLVRLKEVAKLPGLGFKEAIQGSINLQAAGLSAQRSERALKAFGNALATVGKGKAELDGVILALSQIETKGKVSAEEINQLAERVPQIRKAIIAAFGTADTEILQKAKITSKLFIDTVTKELEKLPQVTGGAKNTFENLRDDVFQALLPIGRKILEVLLPAIERLTPKILAMLEGFQKLSPGVQDATLAFGAFAIAGGPVLRILGDLSTLLVQIRGIGGIASILGGASGATGAAGLLSTLAAVPPALLLITGALIAGGIAWLEYSRQVESSVNQIEIARKRAMGIKTFLGPNNEVTEVGPGQILGPGGVGTVDLKSFQTPLKPGMTVNLKSGETLSAEEAAARKRVQDALSGKGGGGGRGRIGTTIETELQRLQKELRELNSDVAGFERFTSKEFKLRVRIEDVRDLKSSLEEILTLRRSLGEVVGAPFPTTRQGAQGEVERLGAFKTARDLMGKQDILGPLKQSATAEAEALGRVFQELDRLVKNALPMSVELTTEQALAENELFQKLSQTNPALAEYYRQQALAADATIRNTQAAQAFNTIQEQLNDQLLSFQNLSTQQSTALKLQGDAYKNLTDEQRNQLLALAGQVDQQDAFQKQIEEARRATDRFANTLRGLFDTLFENGPKAFFDKMLSTLKRTLAQMASDLATSSVMRLLGFGGGQQTAGATSGGGLGGVLGGLLGGGGTGGGGFLTGGFAGGNPAAAALGGQGGLLNFGGGLLSKIFGGGGGYNPATNPGGLDIITGGQTGAGGVFGAATGAGGFLSKIPLLGKLLGGGGAALFSNPVTAIIGGALIAAPFIGKLFGGLFGNKILKSLKGLIRGEYGIEVKSDQVLGNIKAMGEGRFGKAFKSKQIETIRLPDVREMLAEYAERTGQKGNSKLFSVGNLQDAYAPENTFTRRAMGGPLAAGQAAIVGERRPEVFVPNQSGYVYPSVGDFNAAQGGGDSRMFEVMVALVDAIQGLRAIPAGHLIERELRGNPDMATRAMVSSFRRRSDASIEARNLVNSR